MSQIKILFVIGLLLSSFIITSNLYADRTGFQHWNDSYYRQNTYYDGGGNGVGMYPGFYYVPPSYNYYMPGVNWGPGVYQVPSTSQYFVVPQPYYYFYQY